MGSTPLRAASTSIVKLSVADSDCEAGTRSSVPSSSTAAPIRPGTSPAGPWTTAAWLRLADRSAKVEPWAVSKRHQPT